MTSPDDPSWPAPGRVAFGSYDPADERRRESLFALGNGVLFVRAAPPEADGADDTHWPGTYRAGCYNRRDPGGDVGGRGHDSLVNLPNWLPLTFRIAGDPEWFSLRRCKVLAYRHELDMHAGIAVRSILFEDRQGRRTRLVEQRLVSMAQPSLAALRLALTPENWSGPVEIRAALDGTVTNGNTDPLVLGSHRHLRVTGRTDGDRLVLAAETLQSRILLGVTARTRAGREVSRRFETGAGIAVEHLTCHVAAGETLTLEKTAAIVASRDPATADPVEASTAAVAAAPDFAALAAAHRRAWERLWLRVGIEAENRALQQGVTFHAFHLLQTVSPHTVPVDAGLPSRGWQEAYHGQIFWDEIFAFPFLNHRFPEIARALLLYRYRRLPAARRAAREAGYRGAMFPWRSATTGDEATPCFQISPITGKRVPDHTRLQRHIGAAIAHNAWTYALATGDMSFLAEYGAELIVEIARFWASIARHDPAEDRYDICGVIGPDEYHEAYPGAAAPGLDNNAYTNVMAATALLHAGEALDALPPPRREELVRKLAIGDEERARWTHVAQRLRVCFHDDGVISQFRGFDRLAPFDRCRLPEDLRGRRVDWALDACGDTVNAYQVTKQADVLMLFHLLEPDELMRLLGTMGYVVDAAQLRRTLAYYLDRVTHESSLSHVVCAGALAWADLRESWRFFQRSLCIDLDPDNSASAAQGLHLGAMTGTLDILQRHYLGLRARGDDLLVRPTPPPELGPVRMRLQHRGRHVTAAWDGARLRIAADAANRVPLRVRHDGGPHMLRPGEAMDIHAPPSVGGGVGKP